MTIYVTIWRFLKFRIWLDPDDLENALKGAVKVVLAETEKEEQKDAIGFYTYHE